MGITRGKTPFFVCKVACFSILLGFAAFVFLWNLGASSISARSDEVIYVRTTQSILHNGALLPLKHGSVPMYEKPPLKLWLGSIGPLLWGESNLSFRILDGLLGVFVVGVTATLAFAITKNAAIAFMSGTLLLSMPELVIAQHGFRHAVLDGLLCAITLLGASFAWRMATGPRAPTPRDSFLLGILWGLAVLTKSVAGVVPAACSIFAITVTRRDRATLRAWKGLSWILVVPIITFGLYAVLLWCLAGPKALKIFLGVEIVQRALSGFEGHNTGSSGFYFWYLFERAGAAPRVLLVSGLVGSCISFMRQSEHRFLLAWSVVPVVLYSCAASRVPWYLSPYLPFIGILSLAGTSSLVKAIYARAGIWSRYLALAVIALCSTPPLYRSLNRNILEVLHDTKRLEIDLLIERLKQSFADFAIVENSISGHSNPRNGRFNVEGIYRESLRPNLRAVAQLSQLDRRPGEVLFVKESSIAGLVPGWQEVGRLAPYPGRPWAVIAVIYPPENINGNM